MWAPLEGQLRNKFAAGKLLKMSPTRTPEGNQETQNKDSDEVSQGLYIIAMQKDITQVNECYVTKFMMLPDFQGKQLPQCKQYKSCKYCCYIY